MLTVKELFKDVDNIDEDVLVQISDKLWGYNAENNGWDSVLNYIAKHR